MIVRIVGQTCYVYKQDSDPVFRPTSGGSSWSPPGWYGAESRLLHHVLRTLNARGYDLIKKRMWQDGHMVGTEHTQYLRSRDIRRKPSICIYHADHAVEIAAELFNKVGMVELAVEYGLTEEDDGAASREHVQAIEATHPCFEVSWDAPCRSRKRRDDERSRTVSPLQGLHESEPSTRLVALLPWRVPEDHRPAHR